MAEMEVKDNSRAVEEEIIKRFKKAAKVIGGIAESHAKEYCPVDTGLLRNSITFAIGGGKANKPVYYDNDMKQMGEYEGEAPKDDEGQVTVYIGTNVKYGIFQELGAPNINLPAQPFLRPAIENHKEEYEQAMKLYGGKL